MFDETQQLTQDEWDELQRVYLSEVDKNVRKVRDVLDQLLLSPDHGAVKGSLDQLERYYHTLRGDFLMMGFDDIGKVSSEVEGIIILLQQQDDINAIDLQQILTTSLQLIDRLIKNPDEQNAERIYGPFIQSLSRYRVPVGNTGTQIFSCIQEPSARHHLEIELALKNAENVYKALITIHQQCGEKTVAALMIKKQVVKHGKLICSMPTISLENSIESNTIEIIFSSLDELQDLKENLSITGITQGIRIDHISV